MTLLPFLCIPGSGFLNSLGLSSCVDCKANSTGAVVVVVVVVTVVV